MVRKRWGRWRRMGLVGTGWMGLLAVAAPGGSAQSEGVDVGLARYAPAHVRADFTAGVRALHNFWWEEAEDRFAAVVEQAPEFPLGYWGRAMALHTNPFGHQRPPVDSMLALLAPLGETREDRLSAAGSAPVGDYLEALETLLEAGDAARVHPAYVEAMARLAQRYPADLEAQAFYARALLLNEPVWGRATATWPVAVLASRAVLDRDPDHPGALHYLIHALDRPETAVDGLDAAERYARVRTGASHAVHMPSHIYMQSGMWERVIEGNRRALEVSREFMARTGRDARSLDAHAVDFLVYALLQTGRWNAAEELIGEFREHRETFQSGALRWYDGLWSAVFALHTGRGPADSLPRSGYASLNESLVQVALAVRAGDPEAVAAADEALQALAAERDAPDWRLAAAQSSALVHRAHRRFDQAVEVLRPALRIQQEMVRPNETPSPVLPPEEQLAEDLFQLGRFEEAVGALDALDARWPRRIRALHLRARIAARTGDGEEARRRYGEIAEQLRDADPDHPVADEARRFLEGMGAGSP